MDAIHELAEKARRALEVSLQAAVEFVQDAEVEPEAKLKAIDQIVRMSRVILSKTLPDLKATHEIHTNTNDLTNLLLPILGPEETQKRIDALEKNLLPKTAAGRPKIIDAQFTQSSSKIDGKPSG